MASMTTTVNSPTLSSKTLLSTLHQDSAGSAAAIVQYRGKQVNDHCVGRISELLYFHLNVSRPRQPPNMIFSIDLRQVSFFNALSCLYPHLILYIGLHYDSCDYQITITMPACLTDDNMRYLWKYVLIWLFASFLLLFLFNSTLCAFMLYENDF